MHFLISFIHCWVPLCSTTYNLSLSQENHIWKFFLAFYGNLNPGTGFDNNNSDGTAAIIEPKPLGNRTDFLQLTKNGSQDVLAYMICNFSQWETKQSTRDHCENLILFKIFPTLSINAKDYCPKIIIYFSLQNFSDGNFLMLYKKTKQFFLLG